MVQMIRFARKLTFYLNPFWYPLEGDSKSYWVISNIKDLGTNTGLIYSQSEHELTDDRNIWSYFDYDSTSGEYTTITAGSNNLELICRNEREPSKYNNI